MNGVAEALMNIFFVLKGSKLFYSYLLSLQLVFCCVAAVKSSLPALIFSASFELKECILRIRK